ncbi:MAG: hypothetical protein WCH76_00445 [Candidatus Riflemargulisbacteria bacterium]
MKNKVIALLSIKEEEMSSDDSGPRILSEEQIVMEETDRVVAGGGYGEFGRSYWERGLTPEDWTTVGCATMNRLNEQGDPEYTAPFGYEVVNGSIQELSPSD